MPNRSAYADKLPDGFRMIVVDDVRPTQSVYGRLEIDSRTEEIKDLKDKPKKLFELQMEKYPEVVLGPEGSIFVVDGHHFALACMEAGIKEIPMKIVADYSKETNWELFHNTMEAKKWVYLKEMGKAITWDQLPRKLSKMKDDPYRTLAWLLRKSGVYKALRMPFQEFEIADYLRERIKFDPKSRSSWKDAIVAGAELLAKGSADNLPGWTGKKVEDCSIAKSIVKDVMEK